MKLREFEKIADRLKKKVREGTISENLGDILWQRSYSEFLATGEQKRFVFDPKDIKNCSLDRVNHYRDKIASGELPGWKYGPILDQWESEIKAGYIDEDRKHIFPLDVPKQFRRDVA